jgi:hypothetical protein
MQILVAYLGSEVIEFLKSDRMGFKTLILLSCGPAMTVPSHFRVLEALVQK